MTDEDQTDNQSEDRFQLPTVLVVLGLILFGAMWVLVILSFEQQDTTKQRNEALSALIQSRAGSQELLYSALADLGAERFIVDYCSTSQSDPVCGAYVSFLENWTRTLPEYKVPEGLPEDLRFQIRASRIQRGEFNATVAYGWDNHDLSIWKEGVRTLENIGQTLVNIAYYPESLTPEATPSPTPTPEVNLDFARQNPEQSR